MKEKAPATFSETGLEELLEEMKYLERCDVFPNLRDFLAEKPLVQLCALSALARMRKAGGPARKTPEKAAKKPEKSEKAPKEAEAAKTAVSESADPCLLDEKAAAAFLGVSQKALQAWRMKRVGPPYARMARKCIRYREEDLRKFVEERMVRA